MLKATGIGAPTGIGTSAVRLQKVNKWYGQFHVLRNVDLEIVDGERVVLWGPSGSGKTSLLRCIAGLEAPQSGRIEVRGVAKPVGMHARPTTTGGVGMVFQSSSLFLHMRVIDNLTIGLSDVRKMPKEKAHEVAIEQLRKVRMSAFADQYPGQLSGGQQQRVEIARALCMEPEVLLFDEPTAALDPELRSEVQALIAEVAEGGRTIVIATHEEQLVRGLSARMVLMADGEIVGRADPADYFRRGERA